MCSTTLFDSFLTRQNVWDMLCKYQKFFLSLFLLYIFTTRKFFRNKLCLAHAIISRAHILSRAYETISPTRLNPRQRAGQRQTKAGVF